VHRIYIILESGDGHITVITINNKTYRCA
jgi:hypothetical protein